jgi:hypothetical protein
VRASRVVRGLKEEAKSWRALPCAHARGDKAATTRGWRRPAVTDVGAVSAVSTVTSR